MSEIAERYERVASRFTDRVRSVPAGAWDRPAPCEGWVARDVVRHLVEWFPAFLATAGGPSLPAGHPDVVHDMLIGMEPLDEVLRASGQYGPRVAVTPDADEQTRLIAFTGRTP